jgi:hypothetical protein
MSNLILSPTRKYFRIGDKDDYVVLDGRRVIGRIMLRRPGHPWFWTITAPDIPPSLDKRGYSATREEAMGGAALTILARYLGLPNGLRGLNRHSETMQASCICP